LATEVHKQDVSKCCILPPFKTSSI
ncbi:unnamed protein product, partial [Allacma fusca]